MCDKCTEVKERPNSVEVSQNAKGDFSFKVKIYFDGTPPTDNIELIYKELHRKFK